ncbi:MAG: hypothetical protein RL885_11990 [Planctomycetota bacterium]
MLFKITVAVLTSLLLGSCTTYTDLPPSVAWEGADQWAQAPSWDDGKAEVATYSATRVTYGNERAYELNLITVKERFTRQHWTKADAEPEEGLGLDVLKQNQIERWQTENYPYTVMTSVFVPRSDVSLPLKITMLHNEWCGNTFKELAGWLDPPVLRTHSYWDGEGDRELELKSGSSLVAFDQLLLALRSLDRETGFELEVSLVPTLVSSKVGDPGPLPATIRVAGEETVTCGIGEVPCRKIEVSWEGEMARLWFAKDRDQVLVKLEQPGRTALLEKLRRWAYWDRSQPDPSSD